MFIRVPFDERNFHGRPPRRHAQDRAPVVAPVDLPEDGREARGAHARRAASWTSSTATASGSAAGFYNGHSRIALRVLTADPDEADRRRRSSPARSASAVALRRDVLKLDAVTDAYRLVHSEGDGLSGLVVDRFGRRCS